MEKTMENKETVEIDLNQEPTFAVQLTAPTSQLLVTENGTTQAVPAVSVTQVGKKYNLIIGNIFAMIATRQQLIEIAPLLLAYSKILVGAPLQPSQTQSLDVIE